MGRLSPESRVSAEVVALKALGWIAGQDDLLPVFLGASGAGPADLRQRAQDPDFLASVLDFLVMDDAWVMSFCEAEGLPYTAPLAARQSLAGQAERNWT